MNTLPPGKWLVAYLLTFAVFMLIDLLWLGVVAKGLYRRQLGGLLAEEVNWAAAFIFYLLFVVGIFIFAIAPGLQKASFSYALLYGALFGFFTYATYDLTNLATLKGWPVKIVVIDIVWGAVLCSLVAAAGFRIAKWLLPV
ncbi:MAG: DUF2177 family protein [Chitinophagaceae bacterium]|nr:DUF2177 family protein [Chitinophagaceae bacterium]